MRTTFFNWIQQSITLSNCTWNKIEYKVNQNSTIHHTIKYRKIHYQKSVCLSTPEDRCNPDIGCFRTFSRWALICPLDRNLRSISNIFDGNSSGSIADGGDSRATCFMSLLGLDDLLVCNSFWTGFNDWRKFTIAKLILTNSKLK